MNPETKIQNACLLAVGTMPDVLAWRQHVGKYRAISNADQIISIGVPGMADCLAVVAVTVTPEMVGKKIGVAVAAEFKTATGKQAMAQKLWQHAFTQRGGVYRLVRSEADMLRLIDDVRAGLFTK